MDERDFVRRRSVDRRGAGFGPFADGGDVFGAGDTERLSGGDFREKDLRGELLLCGEGGVKARDDGLFDFCAGEAFAHCCKLYEIEVVCVSAPFFEMQGEERFANF